MSNESPISEEDIVALSSSARTHDNDDYDDNNDNNLLMKSPGVRGSSILGCTFNFTNSIIGAGALGLGGAFARSGGIISIISIFFFGILTKFSLDMTIFTTIQTEGAGHSYESLGQIAYGKAGWASVLLSKMLYSFGCLVAYLIVIKDNFGSGLGNLMYGTEEEYPSSSWFEQLLRNDRLITLVVSFTIILPLSLLRDIGPLSKFSAVSIFSMDLIVIIVIYLFVVDPDDNVRLEGGDKFEKWLEVRPGYLDSVGIFVFTFVSHHIAHLAYESLDSPIRNIHSWKRVTLFSMAISLTVSLSIGLFVYMTFWQETRSDIFVMYPPSFLMDSAKLLLCITMMLTFPLPFVTCREMIVILVSDLRDVFTSSNTSTTNVNTPKTLLQDHEEDNDEKNSPTSCEDTRTILNNRENVDTSAVNSDRHWILPGGKRQLILEYHILLTSLLWMFSTLLAIIAPSLGDVLDLVGCATGTLIAFVLPALFSIRLFGYTFTDVLILLVGGIVGTVGTYYSFTKLFHDMSEVKE